MIFYKVSYILLKNLERKIQVKETTVDVLEAMLQDENIEVIAYNRLEIAR